jgi:hypothetical protein
MPMISLDEAATRFGLPPEVIEEWAKKGLLHVHTDITPGYYPPAWVEEQQVDGEVLARVAESLGWLHHSVEDWDDDEGE